MTARAQKLLAQVSELLNDDESRQEGSLLGPLLCMSRDEWRQVADELLPDQLEAVAEAYKRIAIDAAAAAAYMDYRGGYAMGDQGDERAAAAAEDAGEKIRAILSP